MARRTIRIYPTYKFTEQDPAVGMIREMIRENPQLKLNQAADMAHVSRSTPKGWISRRVLRPQHATMAAIAGAYGKEFYLRDKKR